MSKPSPQVHTLSLALRACGGEAPLAKALGVSADAMSEWLAGRGALPAAVYLKARALGSGKRWSLLFDPPSRRLVNGPVPAAHAPLPHPLCIGNRGHYPPPK